MIKNNYVVTLELYGQDTRGLVCAELCGYDTDGKYKRVNLTHTVTQQDADSLEFYEGCVGYPLLSLPSEDTARSIARKEWKDHFPHAFILEEGSHSSAEPKALLECPDETIATRIDALVAFNDMFEWGVTDYIDEVKLEKCRQWELLLDICVTKALRGDYE